jgi:hypothetical protein
VALATGGIAWAAGGSGSVDYSGASGTFNGLRPTAVGLPQIGANGTIGASDLPNAVRQYHDSGQYDKDIATVAGAAKTYLDRRIASFGEGQRTCTVSFKRTRKRLHGKPLYRRVKHCVAASPTRLKPAIVLDIDETSLSNYSGLVSSGFSGNGTVLPAVSGTGSAIQPTLNLYKDARNRKVAVFFITGRPNPFYFIADQ